MVDEHREELLAPPSRKWLNRLLGLIVVLGIIAALVYTFRPQPDARSIETAQASGAGPKVGALAPEFSLPDLDGHTVKLSDYRGKVVILNFWASWCPPCRAEMPDLQDAHERYREKGVEMVAVDIGESSGTVRQFLREHDYTFTALLDQSTTVAARYRVSAIPTTFFVDRDGVVRAIHRGRISRLSLDRNINALLLSP